MKNVENAETNVKTNKEKVEKYLEIISL